jgi:hypothetical protein
MVVFNFDVAYIELLLLFVLVFKVECKAAWFVCLIAAFNFSCSFLWRSSSSCRTLCSANCCWRRIRSCVVWERSKIWNFKNSGKLPKLS